MTELSVDTSSFKAFARDLKALDPVLRKELSVGMKAAGELVASAARARAGFSTRIPGLIKTGVTGGAIRVYVRPPSAPHVAEEKTYEHGGKDGTFRHPVFGDTTNWVSQPARPFLKPALDANVAAAVAAAKRAVDVALHEVHSHL